MRRALALALALAVATLGGCAITTGEATAELAPCRGRVVHVAYGEPVGCDVRPPQRLDVRLPRRWSERREHRVCDDIGGDLRGRTCRSVDY
jgi:hypothetical protein